jgi:hypothetical protein
MARQASCCVGADDRIQPMAATQRTECLQLVLANASAAIEVEANGLVPRLGGRRDVTRYVVRQSCHTHTFVAYFALLAAARGWGGTTGSRRTLRAAGSRLIFWKIEVHNRFHAAKIKAGRFIIL